MSKGSKVPGSQGPRYLKVLFKYKLDSKEGPSSSILIYKGPQFKYELDSKEGPSCSRLILPKLLFLLSRVLQVNYQCINTLVNSSLSFHTEEDLSYSMPVVYGWC